MRLKRIAAAAAASAACFAMLATAPHASADSLQVYDAGGSGDGVVATFAVKPSIFDPLLQAGALHTETSLNSAAGGSGHSLSAPVFPGSFAVGAIKGAIGCAGLPGGWIFGTYPPYPTCPETQEFVVADSNTATNVTFGPSQTRAVFQAVRDHVKFKIVHAYAHADLGEASSYVKSADYAVVQDDATPPIVSAREVSVTNSGAHGDTQLTQTIQVEMKGVEILGGLIKIGSIVSNATVASDGIAGIANGTFTMSDVTVTMNNVAHRAHIDQDGVTIEDKNQKQKLQLNEVFSETMIQAGITIRAASPLPIVDGAQAEESVAGLQLTFSATPPGVVVPSQLAPVFSQIVDNVPTKCVYELVPPQVDAVAHVPLCFNAASLAPGSHNTPTLSISLASVNAFAVASTLASFGGGDFGSGGTGSLGSDLGSGLGGGTDADVLGEQFSKGSGSTGTGSGSYGLGAGPAPQPRAQVPLGLVARLPSTVPLVAGALFLVLAVALALGPSLRHARAR
jgi:hypothetical protein